MIICTFTADIAVTNQNGATTKRLRNGRRHSYIGKRDLITFAEVKHLNPFPEVLFNFMGLVFEFMPGFLNNQYSITKMGGNLCPIITFTGPSEHSERIQRSLSARYGINVIFSTSLSSGQISSYKSLNKYVSRNAAVSASTASGRDIRGQASRACCPKGSVRPH